MRVGIISMQRVANYGSFLQAYGLKSILEDMGHEVYFIDYREGKPVTSYSKIGRLKYKIQSSTIIRKINDFVKYYILGRKKFVYEYRMFYLKELGIGYKKKREKVDIAIIGSDEVFNCTQKEFNVGFSPMLFGQSIQANKVISYAASFGYTDIMKLRKFELEDKIAKFLTTFSDISVRDENSYQIVENLIGVRPEINLDPVLVANFEIPHINIPYHDFIILYTYKSRTYTEEEREIIKNFCKSNGKTLISIGNSQDWVDTRIQASPLELLSYINSADFIITDTFHGSVFSIKYNKKFATLIREDNKQKLSDLLQRLRQSDRIINSFENLQSIYEKPTDFNETNYLIEKGRKDALEYLSKNLEKQ